MTDLELTRTIQDYRKKINPLTGKCWTWEMIALKYPGVSKALLWKIAKKKNYTVKDNAVRKMLGLSEIIPVPACPDCDTSQAHVHEHGEQPINPETHRAVKKSAYDRNWRRKQEVWLF